MKTSLITAACIVAVGLPASAHRLDEYLQGTLISIDKDRVQAEMTLTPGVAVLPIVLAGVDSDHDGVISEAERRAYADRVLHDLTLTIDGRRLTPRLASMQYPSMDAMMDGRGEIILKFSAELPRGSASRRLVLENRHQSAISAYQVNCLVSGDPDIRISRQDRNYTQSTYELEYVQSTLAGSPVRGAWVGLVALLFAVRFAVLKQSR